MRVITQFCVGTLQWSSVFKINQSIMEINKNYKKLTDTHFLSVDGELILFPITFYLFLYQKDRRHKNKREAVAP